jgi:enoyl-CoA hydratase/carnithine racemase
MMLTGRIVDAEEALHIGLVESVVEPGELVDISVAVAGQIAALPVSAVAAAKRAVQTGMRHGHMAGLQVERELAVAVGLTEDAVEGQRAFVEKRQPRFGDGADWIRTEVERRRARPG